MRQVEALGLVKMDLLGNRALTEIGDAIGRVAASTGGRVMPVVEPVPDGDAKTAAMVREGHTLGLFHLESPAMRNLPLLPAATPPAPAPPSLPPARPPPS